MYQQEDLPVELPRLGFPHVLRLAPFGARLRKEHHSGLTRSSRRRR